MQNNSVNKDIFHFLGARIWVPMPPVYRYEQSSGYVTDSLQINIKFTFTAYEYILLFNLVTTKMYPMERKTGSCKCKGSRCQVCLNVSETETFTSTMTHMSYKINHSFDCNDKCLIYLLTCKTCLKQYVGSTTDCFRYRWNNYKCNDRKFARGEACLQEHLFEHFNSEGHNGFLHDV